MDLTNKKTIKYVLNFYNIWSKKSLGQNFLIDNKILKTIIKSADLNSKDSILEIGPGLGILTQELCKETKEVVAIEKDEKLFLILKENYRKYKNLKLINEDILKVQISKLGIKNYKIVANLPYNIVAPVLKKFLTEKNKPYLMVLMMQYEVAKRICAEPGQMSILSIMVQLYSKPKIINVVQPSSFFPKPKVESAIIKLENIRKNSINNEKDFFRCVKIGFSFPRKTLINNLTAGYQMDKNKIKNIFKKISLNNKVRAQELSIKHWQKLNKLI